MKENITKLNYFLSIQFSEYNYDVHINKIELLLIVTNLFWFEVMQLIFSQWKCSIQ